MTRKHWVGRIVRGLCRGALAGAVCAGAVFGGTGCISQTEVGLRKEVFDCRESLRQQQQETANQKTAAEELQKQLDVARGITPKDLELIFYPERLEIDKLTGGADYDNQPGDDGVTVYLKPIDKEGDVIKTAGDITIQVYDLAAPPDQTFIGEYKIPVEKAVKLWHGKLMTNHYTIKCPFPPGRVPQHEEVTVRATFVDYLTKRVLTAQSTAKVKPGAPSTQPAGPNSVAPPGTKPSTRPVLEPVREPTTRPVHEPVTPPTKPEYVPGTTLPVVPPRKQ